MKITPYISVSNAKKTIEIYKNLFGATLSSHMPFNKHIGEEWGFPDDFDYDNSTMHAVLDFQGSEVYISDSMNSTSSGPVEIVLDYESREALENVWAKVKQMKLRVVMELETQFWGALYGRFVDNDGIGWQLNHNLNNGT